MSYPKPRTTSALLAGIAAYVIWGISPIYYKQISNVPPLIILCHRVVWSVLFLLVIVTAMHAWEDVRAALRSKRTMLTLLTSTLLLAGNWYLFIWTTNTGRIMQASLGYFITPIVTVLMGVLFLLTWAASAIAGWAAFNSQQLGQRQDPVTFVGYLGQADFWNRSFQNWQSEMLAVGSMAIFAVYLRQRGSPESKPVGVAHADTGQTG